MHGEVVGVNFFGNGEVKGKECMAFHFCAKFFFEFYLFYVKLVLFVMPCRFCLTCIYHSHGFICDDMFGFIITHGFFFFVVLYSCCFL